MCWTVTGLENVSPGRVAPSAAEPAENTVYIRCTRLKHTFTLTLWFSVFIYQPHYQFNCTIVVPFELYCIVDAVLITDVNCVSVLNIISDGLYGMLIRKWAGKFDRFISVSVCLNVHHWTCDKVTIWVPVTLHSFLKVRKCFTRQCSIWSLGKSFLAGYILLQKVYFQGP